MVILIVSYEIIMSYSDRVDSNRMPFLLIGIGVLCLMIHFGIYHQTQASAFINQPEFYYNRFVLRDSNGQWVRDVSMSAGFASYLTAGLALASTCGGVMLIVKRKKRRMVANQALDGTA